MLVCAVVLGFLVAGRALLDRALGYTVGLLLCMTIDLALCGSYGYIRKGFVNKMGCHNGEGCLADNGLVIQWMGLRRTDARRST